MPDAAEANVTGLALPLVVIGVIAIAIIVRWIVRRLIDRVTRGITNNAVARRISRTRGGSEILPSLERQQARANTAASLLKSIAGFTILGIAIVVELGVLGVNIAPIIASAGVVGIAVGFGAQSLIKDFLTGIFMIMEDQYGVGDVVDFGVTVGTVEQVGLRVTRVRDFNGVVWHIPNGSITALGNRTQGWGMAIVDVPVAYGEDLDRVGAILRSTATSMAEGPEWNELILDEPPIVAVETMTPLAVTMRVLLKTLAGKNVDVARELRAQVMAALDSAGIRSPSASGAGRAAAEEERPGPT
ncbi:MAG: mechanosensitive ion channel family protein [Candidatus Nanopelagicales bacterium]